MYKLVIEDDEGKTTVVPIIRDEITIGRKEGNTIRLTERNVSRRHARLIKKNGTIEIEDVASRYGTRRNGQKIDGRVPFREGDVVLIGDYRLRLQLDKPKVEGEKAEVKTPEPPVEPEELPAREAARIVVISSNFAGREFTLTRKEMVIGRTEGDIRIDHRSISRNHAKLVRDAGRYKILDLNSANGVKVNGEDYRAVQLKRGDIIELGHVRFRFVEPGEDFIFIRQTEDYPDQPGGSGMGKIVLIGAAVAVFVVIIAVVAAVVLGSDDGKANPKDPDPRVEDTVPKDGSSDDMLAKADDYMSKEQWDRAIVILDLVLDKDPANEGAKTKKSKAIREKPFKRHFDDGKKAIDEKRYEDAIKAFQQIPDGESDYAERIKTEGLLEAARQGLIFSLMETARDELRKNELNGARTAVNRVLDLEPENEEAKELRAQINKKDKDSRKETPPRDNKGGGDTPPKNNNNANNANNDGGGGGGMSADDKRAKRDELLQSARKKSLTGDHDGAIRDATEALKYGGGAQAHYFLALSYEKKGDAPNAIKYFNLWLKSNCGNKLGERVRQKISQLGGTPDC